MSDPTTVVHSDPEILGGTPVFVGTRVPFQNLIDCLVGGESLDECLRANSPSSLAARRKRRFDWP